jgi:hypothetical protein
VSTFMVLLLLLLLLLSYQSKWAVQATMKFW